ncbi:uncharacterized protein METZ01_LOCUS407277, partial [marine metagenome]
VKQFSLAEKLGKRIRHRERVAAQSSNTRELRHEHYHNFLKLRADSLRALIVRLMLGSVEALRAATENTDHQRSKPVGKRCDPDHINILTIEIQWLLFEYGVGVLATDQHGRVLYCARTGYIPGDAINLMIYNRCLGCDQMIRNLIDDLTRASRCAFLVRLHRHL